MLPGRYVDPNERWRFDHEANEISPVHILILAAVLLSHGLRRQSALRGDTVTVQILALNDFHGT